MKKAMFAKGNKCILCPFNCVIQEGRRGICGVRVNKGGELYTLVYGLPVSLALDPIEKKPLFHFHPGRSILSFGTVGCNFRCKGCQNWEIARDFPDEESRNLEYPPDKIIGLAKDKSSDMIAYTYTEPTIFYEYMYDTARIAKAQGIKNVIVSNGYINQEPLRQLCKVIDAANIDLKFFDEKRYIKYSGGKLKPVLDSLKILKEEGVWLEITNLLIPGWSDDMEMFERMCVWIKDNLGEDTPLHISRFFPNYKLEDVLPTPIETLEKAEKIAKKHLKFVYIGNILKDSNTYCPKCKSIIILRTGYEIKVYSTGKCRKCKEIIPGEWE